MTIDPASIPGAWPTSGDFTIPDWDAIARWATDLDESRCHAAYTDIARHWLAVLQSQLGGDYRVVEDGEFCLLTSQNDDDAARSMRLFRGAVERITEECRGVASGDGYGPHIMLKFDESDDYNDYIGQYYPDEAREFAGSSGMMIDQGYSHIVVGPGDMVMAMPVLFHEITHMLVAHLPLPLWLNEGLATSVERALSGYGPLELDKELADQHWAFWNEDTIQEFWNGNSFHTPDESQKLSYNLAEILATRLRELPGYREFILEANWEDAGHTSAIKHLKKSSGEIAALFLGEGPWDVGWLEEEA